MWEDYKDYRIGETITVVKQKMFGLLGKGEEEKSGRIVDIYTMEWEDINDMEYRHEQLTVELENGETVKVWTKESNKYQKYAIKEDE